jgi:ankyrin repeat protein
MAVRIFSLKSALNPLALEYSTLYSLTSKWPLTTGPHLIAYLGNEILMQLLIDTGEVDIDELDDRNQTPLSWAAQEGHVAVARLLIQTNKVDVNAKDNKG